MTGKQLKECMKKAVEESGLNFNMFLLQNIPEEVYEKAVRLAEALPPMEIRSEDMDDWEPINSGAT